MNYDPRIGGATSNCVRGWSSFLVAAAFISGAFAAFDAAGAENASSRRFDDAARWSTVFDDPARDEWQNPEGILQGLELAPDSIVADIGAGTGYFSAKLARAVPRGRVYAVDIEPSMVAHLRERFAAAGAANVEAIQASRDSPNLPEAVDAVLLVNVQSLVANPGDYFLRLKTRLRPNARVAIVSTRPDAERGAVKSMRRPPEHVKREMARQGYVLYAEHDILKYQYFLVFKADGPSPDAGR
jgi:cyclopropane fatty-acyl-phospholipid synthase-like methyltransferase